MQTSISIRKEKRGDLLQRKRRLVLAAGAPAAAAADPSSAGEAVSKLLLLQSADPSDPSCASAAAAVAGLEALCALLSAGSVAAAVEAGAVPALLGALRHPSLSARPAASGSRTVGACALQCLANIAAGETLHAQSVLPALPELLSAVEGGAAELAGPACWALGNLAGDSEALREELRRGGSVGAVCRMCLRLGSADPKRILFELGDESAARGLRTALWALSNLARGVGSVAGAFLGAGAHAIACAALSAALDAAPARLDLAAEALWLCAFLTARGADAAEALLAEGLGPRLRASLCAGARGRDAKVLAPALRCLGNVCLGPEPWAAQVLEADPEAVLGALAAVLAEEGGPGAGQPLAREALWALTSVLTIGRERGEAAMDITKVRMASFESGCLLRAARASAGPWHDPRTREAALALRAAACPLGRVAEREPDWFARTAAHAEVDGPEMVAAWLAGLNAADPEASDAVVMLLDALLQRVGAAVGWAIDANAAEALDEIQYDPRLPDGVRAAAGRIADALFEEEREESSALEARDADAAAATFAAPAAPADGMVFHFAPPAPGAGLGAGEAPGAAGPPRAVDNRPAWMRQG